jgi:hypothetical protein
MLPFTFFAGVFSMSFWFVVGLLLSRSHPTSPAMQHISHFLMALALLIALFGLSALASPVLGKKQDGKRCNRSAGYSWCEAKGKCLRTWEEACE